MSTNPFQNPTPPEVPLRDAPLVRVIAQLRFPPVLSIEKREFVAPFQEEIRGEYPNLRPERTRGVVVGPHGVAPGPKQLAWRFNDVGGKWRVSLAPDFLALETTTYLSRDDFLERLRFVVAALDKHISPKIISRLGIRYIDRICGEQMNQVSKLVRPEVLGISGTPMAELAQHSLSETIFAPHEESRVLVRWGRVPPDGTVDPAAIESVPEPSWILDLDMFSAIPFEFEVDSLIDKARIFAEQLYAFFRWVVTEEFLRQYGGTP